MRRLHGLLLLAALVTLVTGVIGVLGALVHALTGEWDGAGMTSSLILVGAGLALWGLAECLRR